MNSLTDSQKGYFEIRARAVTTLRYAKRVAIFAKFSAVFLYGGILYQLHAVPITQLRWFAMCEVPIIFIIVHATCGLSNLVLNAEWHVARIDRNEDHLNELRKLAGLATVVVRSETQ